MDFISGEKIQLICKLYFGSGNDFTTNPFIYNNERNIPILDLKALANMTSYNNPNIIYAHGHNIQILSSYIHIFLNPFVLITHNSDQNVIDNPITQNISSCPKLIQWYAQNVGYENPKISFLPIGIANRMWSHGNPSIFENLKDVKKTDNIFMNFLIQTNFVKRNSCLKILTNKGIPFLPQVEPRENIERMKKYKFCICPEGNGFDTHRLWEALYVKCVPILLRSGFTEIIQKETGLPMILLKSWNDLDIDKLPSYNIFDFETGKKYLSIEHHINKILSNY